MFLLSFYIIKFNHSNITNGLKVDLVYRMLRISNSLAQAPHRRTAVKRKVFKCSFLPTYWSQLKVYKKKNDE